VRRYVQMRRAGASQVWCVCRTISNPSRCLVLFVVMKLKLISLFFSFGRVVVCRRFVCEPSAQRTVTATPRQLESLIRLSGNERTSERTKNDMLVFSFFVEQRRWLECNSHRKSGSFVIERLCITANCETSLLGRVFARSHQRC
jgi:hypothetical protein